MTLTLAIPAFETERLVLRAPRLEDSDAFVAFLASDRARFVGGPVTDTRQALRSFGHIVGLWVLRGFSAFVAEDRATGAPLGIVGPWWPQRWPEPEFAWSLWDPAAEGEGYVTEAMRVLIPWAWARPGLDSAVSVIDADNTRSIRVAERLGATLDRAATEAANRPGSPFHDPDGADALIYRHTPPEAA